MPSKTAFVVLTALAAAAAASTGCSSSNSGDAVGTVRASLHRAKTCGDLLSDLKADAIYKLDKGINLQVKGIQSCQAKYPDSQCAYGGSQSLGDSFGAPASGAGAPRAADDAASPGGSKSSSPNGESAQSYSETNTQVKGVDEADIVKNDGKNLYVLHGRAFKIVNAWPASELAESASIDIEGSPTEMFVADGKAVVYSQVNGAAIFSAAGVAPKAQYTDYAYGGARPGGGVGMPAPSPDAPMPEGGGEPQVYVPLTKITVLALDGGTPTVTREVYFEGAYLDARRVGPHVRTVLQSYQYGPQLKYGVYEVLAPQGGSGAGVQDPKTGTEMIAALEKLRAVNRGIIDATRLADWLPYTFLKEGAGVSAHTVACEDFYVPTAGSTESGLTEVASLDLSNPAAPPKETAILGRAETVYASADTLYLAAQAWVEPPFLTYGGGGDVVVSDGTAAPPSGTSAPPPPTDPGAPGEIPGVTPHPRPSPKPSFDMNVRPRTSPQEPPVLTYPSNRTHVHKFEFRTSPDFPNYVASGSVAGAVKDQFSLDEKDDLLRIATTESRVYATLEGVYVSPDSSAPQPNAPAPTRPATVSHVFVLGQDGAWLEPKGAVGDLAPNERIYSVRFVGPRGYVVTFRQVDPLFVVDLANPTAPKVLAALKIPGFSEYMHPLDDNHLLTIGRNADASGRQQGLKLQIFDVTDGANPKVMKEFAYTGEEYGSSEAEYDHKAFTYFADKGLLAFPYYSYDGTNGGMRSSLELFKVDLANGFAKLGSIDHSALLQSKPQGYCGGYFGPSVRRGVFLESFVYSVSYGGIVAKDTNDLAAAGAALSLPGPQANDGYGAACPLD